MKMAAVTCVLHAASLMQPCERRAGKIKSVQGGWVGGCGARGSAWLWTGLGLRGVSPSLPASPACP